MSDPYTDEQRAMDKWAKRHYVPARTAKPKKKPKLPGTGKTGHVNKISKTRCKYCKVTENLTIDHKIPRVAGGTNDPKNLQCLCKECNTMKSAMTEKQVKNIFKWFLKIQQSRIEHGKKPYTLR